MCVMHVIHVCHTCMLYFFLPGPMIQIRSLHSHQVLAQTILWSCCCHSTSVSSSLSREWYPGLCVCITSTLQRDRGLVLCWTNYASIIPNVSVAWQLLGTCSVEADGVPTQPSSNLTRCACSVIFSTPWCLGECWCYFYSLLVIHANLMWGQRCPVPAETHIIMLHTSIQNSETTTWFVFRNHVFDIVLKCFLGEIPETHRNFEPKLQPLNHCCCYMWRWFGSGYVNSLHLQPLNMCDHCRGR